MHKSIRCSRSGGGGRSSSEGRGGRSTMRPRADATWRPEMNYRRFRVTTASRCCSSSSSSSYYYYQGREISMDERKLEVALRVVIVSAIRTSHHLFFLAQELVPYRCSYCSCSSCSGTLFKKPKAPSFQKGSG